MDIQSTIAATRFGLGIRPEEITRVTSSPRGWLMDQLVQAPPPMRASFTSSRQLLAGLYAVRTGDKEENKEARQKAKKEARKDTIGLFREDMLTRFAYAATTSAPFHERLVNFWSNHFTVSIKKGGPLAIAAAYEYEAIRPHVMGRFADMLQAVTHHPAMLMYLDNAQSIGPGSRMGMRAGKGLNENLAREIMELHTLGVNGGYTQADVTTFAKVITGWTVDRRPDNIGNFVFTEPRHEPGAKTILGRTYADNGENQGVALLNDLAIHPSTARHIGFKLAQHFIADDPPQKAVDALAQRFLASGGDLKSVYQTLIELNECWDPSLPKMKSSYDLVVSAARLCGLTAENVQWCVASLNFLGNVPFTATSPAGFSDAARDIGGPDAVLRRVEWAQTAAVRLVPNRSYRELAEMALGPVMSEKTRETLGAAHNEREGLALLLASPDFQRR
jgi:uncharacterized protein (DUF1800 family)